MYGCFHNQYTTPPSPKTIWDVDIMLFLFRNRIHICYKVYKVTQFVPCVNVYPYYGNMFLSIMLSLLSKVCIYNWLRHLVDNNNIMDTVCFTQMYKKNCLSSQFSFLYSFLLFFKYFFSGWPLSVLRGHSGCSSPPQQPMTSDFEGFSIPEFIHYIYFPILILEKEPVFPFSMFSAKQGNYWYHFITSLVWRGPWHEIEPGTSCTQSQHYTTRLSRRVF